jgi:hypothetical protein
LSFVMSGGEMVFGVGKKNGDGKGEKMKIAIS